MAGENFHEDRHSDMQRQVDGVKKEVDNLRENEKEIYRRLSAIETTVTGHKAGTDERLKSIEGTQEEIKKMIHDIGEGMKTFTKEMADKMGQLDKERGEEASRKLRVIWGGIVGAIVTGAIGFVIAKILGGKP